MRADRRLGQHFLRDPEVLEEIAALADVHHSAGVLEVGPGEGALTAFLVGHGRPVVAVDVDERVPAVLAERFGPEVVVHLLDAARADLIPLLPSPDAAGRRPVIVGNLPYNAGTAIFRRLLPHGRAFERLVVMLQREVAERIAASEGSRSYGLLSVETALSARAWVTRIVPPSAFRPRPKVHSAVLLVEPLADPVLEGTEREAFLSFVGRLFTSRRKTLANAEVERSVLDVVGVDPGRRAESLPVETLLALWRAALDVEDASG